MELFSVSETATFVRWPAGSGGDAKNEDGVAGREAAWKKAAAER
jgi:hypothetical protein